MHLDLVLRRSGIKGYLLDTYLRRKGIALCLYLQKAGSQLVLFLAQRVELLSRHCVAPDGPLNAAYDIQYFIVLGHEIVGGVLLQSDVQRVPWGKRRRTLRASSSSLVSLYFLAQNSMSSGAMDASTGIVDIAGAYKSTVPSTLCCQLSAMVECRVHLARDPWLCKSTANATWNPKLVHEKCAFLCRRCSHSRPLPWRRPAPETRCWSSSTRR